MPKLSTIAIKDFFGFMRKREEIRLRRAEDKAWPWSDDPILNAYSFTNVKRFHDKTSRQLIDTFYKKHRDDPMEEILLNCATFRYFGTFEFAQAVGWQTDFEPKLLKRVSKARLAAGQKVFTGAYIVPQSGLSGAKHDVVVDNYLKPLWKNAEKICRAADRNWSWKECIEELQELPGFGGTGFMAKEVILDTRYTNFWDRGRGREHATEPRDLNLWTPVGPGSMRGAATLLGAYGAKLNGKDTRQVCLDLFKAVMDDDRGVLWPDQWVSLELHDIQFQLCEFFKYVKTQRGDGRPRSKFIPPHLRKE